jgi:hypothetical protein
LSRMDSAAAGTATAPAKVRTAQRRSDIETRILLSPEMVPQTAQYPPPAERWQLFDLD